MEGITTMSSAELRRIYVAAGRPGAAKFRDAARRGGIELTHKRAAEFVKDQAEGQVFGKARSL
jgi:hypothetical protein